MVHIILSGSARGTVRDIGLQLSHAIARPLYIIDDLIERGETVSIATIIQDEGMEAYREIESVYLESVLRRDAGVIVLGTRTLETPRNVELLAGHCVIQVADPNC